MPEPKKRGNNWSALVLDYTDEAGKKRYRRISAPTKAEWYAALSEFEKEKELSREEREEKRRLGLTVGEAIDKYIEASGHTLDPSTLSGYRKIREHAFPELMELPVANLTDHQAQTAIDKECTRITQGNRKALISPKTVHNEWGLVARALRAICGKTYNIRLPRIPQKIIDIPEPDVVLSIIKGEEIELPCLLALWLTFSMSEIRGFNCSSVRNGILFVDDVLVRVDNIDMRKKNAKVDTRTRGNAIPPYIMQLIEALPNYRHYLETGEDSPLIPLSYAQISSRFYSLMHKHGYNMNFHKLRHESASIMAKLQIQTKIAQEKGGWKTDYTMKRTYQHTFQSDRLEADEKMNDFISDIINSLE